MMHVREGKTAYYAWSEFSLAKKVRYGFSLDFYKLVMSML